MDAISVHRGIYGTQQLDSHCGDSIQRIIFDTEVLGVLTANTWLGEHLLTITVFIY